MVSIVDIVAVARNITVVGSLSCNLTGYAIKVELDTASIIVQGKMRADCSDMHVRTVGASGLLGVDVPFFIEQTTCNSVATVLWFHAPFLQMGGVSVFQLVYGDPLFVVVRPDVAAGALHPNDHGNSNMLNRAFGAFGDCNMQDVDLDVLAGLTMLFNSIEDPNSPLYVRFVSLLILRFLPGS